MSSVANGGTIFIKSPPSAGHRPHAVALGYEMGLIRVSTPFAASSRRFCASKDIAVLSPSKRVRTTCSDMDPSTLSVVRKRPPRVNENCGLKRLLASKLQEIKEQSEAILFKDRQLRELKVENRSLQVKLGKFSDVDVAVEPVKKKRRRKRAEALEERPEKRVGSAAKATASESRHLETAEVYFNLQGEAFRTAERESIKRILAQSEVPRWRRTVPVSPSGCAVEGTAETVDDKTFTKRHVKPEVLEKRLKRWDMQRLRRQRQVQTLRARAAGATSSRDRDASFCYEGANTHGQEGEVKTFYPDPAAVTHIVVGERLPVAAFGHALPEVEPQTFSLPWLPSHQSESSFSQSCDLLAKGKTN